MPTRNLLRVVTGYFCTEKGSLLIPSLPACLDGIIFADVCWRGIDSLNRS